MTTIPARNGTLDPTIRSLMGQTHRADEVRIHTIPGVELDASGWSEALFAVNVDDHGPVTKLWPAIDAALAPDDLIVTVDDDIVYAPNWLALIAAAAEQYPSDAIGFSGWNVASFLAGRNAYDFMSAPQERVDVLEGWAGVAYRRRFFDGVAILNPPPAFQFVDDVWISSRLAKKGINRRLIAFPQARPVNGDAPGLHTRHDFREMNRHAAIEGFSS